MSTSLFVLTCGFRYFWKWRNIRKKVRWNRRLNYSVHFCTRVSRKFHLHTLYTYVLDKIWQNGAKFMQRLFLGSKNHMNNLSNFRQAMESPKSWNLMFFSKKYIPSAKILYTEDLPNITFNYLLMWRFTKLLMSFFKPVVIFHDTTLLYLFSSNITYFLQK